MLQCPQSTPWCDTRSPTAAPLPFIHVGGHPPTPLYHEINFNPKNKGCPPPPPHGNSAVCNGGRTEWVPRGGSPTLGCDAMVGMWGHSHLWDRPQLWAVTLWGRPQLWGVTLWGGHRDVPTLRCDTVGASPTLGCDTVECPQLWVGHHWGDTEVSPTLGCDTVGVFPTSGCETTGVPPTLVCDTAGASPTLGCDTVTRCPHFPWEVLKLLTVSPTSTQCPQGGPFGPSA